MATFTYWDIGIIGAAIAAIISIFRNKKEVSLTLLLVFFLMIILKLVFT